jgi:hypothetical protein
LDCLNRYNLDADAWETRSHLKSSVAHQNAYEETDDQDEDLLSDEEMDGYPESEIQRNGESEQIASLFEHMELVIDGLFQMNPSICHTENSYFLEIEASETERPEVERITEKIKKDQTKPGSEITSSKNWSSSGTCVPSPPNISMGAAARTEATPEQITQTQSGITHHTSPPADIMEELAGYPLTTESHRLVVRRNVEISEKVCALLGKQNLPKPLRAQARRLELDVQVLRRYYEGIETMATDDVQE